MKVLIENQLYDARGLFETSMELKPEILKSWKPGITIDATDEEVKDLLESLDFSVLDI